MKTNSSRRYAIMAFFFLNILCFSNKGYSQSTVWQNLQVSVIQPDTESSKLRICVYNPEEKKVTITISNNIDVDYSVLTSEQYFDQLFNLNGINDGKYILLITAGKERIRKELEINTVSRNDRKLIFK